MPDNIDELRCLEAILEHGADQLHGREELIRLFRQVRRRAGPALAVPRSHVLATLLVALCGRASAMVTTVVGRPHVFVRMEYGVGDFVDVDAAGDEIGEDEVRVDFAGRMYPEALPVELGSIDPTILSAAAEVARLSDYPKTAHALIRASRRSAFRLLS